MKNLAAAITPNEIPNSFRYYYCYDHSYYKDAMECQKLEDGQQISKALAIPESWPRLLDPIFLSRQLGAKVAIRKVD